MPISQRALTWIKQVSPAPKAAAPMSPNQGSQALEDQIIKFLLKLIIILIMILAEGPSQQCFACLRTVSISTKSSISFLPHFSLITQVVGYWYHGARKLHCNAGFCKSLIIPPLQCSPSTEFTDRQHPGSERISAIGCPSGTRSHRYSILILTQYHSVYH